MKPLPALLAVLAVLGTLTGAARLPAAADDGFTPAVQRQGPRRLGERQLRTRTRSS